MIRLYPGEISKPLPGVPYDTLMLEPGDGRVTKPSLLGRDALNPAVPRHDYSFFPLAFSFSLCETHERLTGNTNFTDVGVNIDCQKLQEANGQLMVQVQAEVTSIPAGEVPANTIPLIRHRNGWPRLMRTVLIGAGCAVALLWACFAIDYPTTRDIYFTLAIAHILAEVPFLMRLA